MIRLNIISKRYAIAVITAIVALIFILSAASLSISGLHSATSNSLVRINYCCNQHKIYFIFWHIILSIAIITACSLKLKQFIKKHPLTPKQVTQFNLFYGLLVGAIWTVVLITFW